jgi:predicted negative regulator of RcsB-dependent stress response
MSPPDETDSQEPIPRMQRLFDNVFLLLIAGIVVMFVVYTGWGLWEIVTMPQATLP